MALNKGLDHFPLSHVEGCSSKNNSVGFQVQNFFRKLIMLWGRKVSYIYLLKRGEEGKGEEGEGEGRGWERGGENEKSTS